MSTGVSMPHPKTGGRFVTMATGTAFFASIVGTFYYTRVLAHRKDNQTWIVRHGQQPKNPRYDMTGPRLVQTLPNQPVDLSSVHIPLPGNKDNQGNDTIVGRLMSAIVGRGFSPDGRTPNNKQVPVAQRLNEAGTHYYTKSIPFDVKAYNASHRP